MFAISFDMVIRDLEQNYGTPYNRAYYEIKKVLEKHEFYWFQGSTYMIESNDLGKVLGAILALKSIDWFRKSVRDIRGYRVEDWSDFTPLFK